MGPPSYMQSVFVRNVGMRRIPVSSVCLWYQLDLMLDGLPRRSGHCKGIRGGSVTRTESRIAFLWLSSRYPSHFVARNHERRSVWRNDAAVHLCPELSFLNLYDLFSTKFCYVSVLLGFLAGVLGDVIPALRDKLAVSYSTLKWYNIY
jgi:hypothetical protein